MTLFLWDRGVCAWENTKFRYLDILVIYVCSHFSSPGGEVREGNNADIAAINATFKDLLSEKEKSKVLSVIFDRSMMFSRIQGRPLCQLPREGDPRLLQEDQGGAQEERLLLAHCLLGETSRNINCADYKKPAHFLYSSWATAVPTRSARTVSWTSTLDLSPSGTSSSRGSGTGRCQRTSEGGRGSSLSR